MTLNKKDIKQIIETMFEVIEPFMIAIQKEFDGQTRKTDKIEKKVTDIKIGQEDMFAKLVGLDRRVMYIEDRLTEIVKNNERQFVKTEKRLDRIEKELNEIKKDLAELKTQKKLEKKQLVDLETRVEKLELKYAY